jgi:two-component system osmolarity sensor histidine kinase EnvZ
MFLKRFAPKSLYGRFLLIIIVPAVAVQLVATYMFYARHWESMSRNISASIASEIAMVLDKTRGASPEERAEILREAKKYLNLDIAFHGKNIPGAVMGKPTQRFPELESAIHELLKDSFYLVENTEKALVTVVMTRASSHITISMPRKRLLNPTTYIYIMWTMGTGGILLAVSILFLRNQVRSIVRLSEAADKFGKGQDVANFKPQGALEVKQAAKAFLDMKERIRRQVHQRTEMLAGVSHDLRTPLTRMKLQLALMKKSSQTEELLQDVAEMEHMVEGYLEFVRSGESEKSEPLELMPFLQNFADTYRSEKDRITLMLEDDITIHARPQALRRCLANLMDNALRYAKYVRLSSLKAGDHIEVIIEDNGPGIPAESREAVFAPFVRLDTSRNLETGGVGLGLSIARDIIHQHGGHIQLAESAMGGLKVTLSLPL